MVEQILQKTILHDFYNSSRPGRDSHLFLCLIQSPGFQRPAYGNQMHPRRSTGKWQIGTPLTSQPT